MKTINIIKDKHMLVKELRETADKVYGEMLDKINNMFDLLFCGGARDLEQDSYKDKKFGILFGGYVRAELQELSGGVDLNLTSVYIKQYGTREIIWNHSDTITILGNGEAAEDCELLSDILTEFFNKHGFTVRSSVTGWLNAEDAAKVKKALERVANYDKALENTVVESNKNTEEKMSKKRMVKIEMDVNALGLGEVRMDEDVLRTCFRKVANEAARNVASLRDSTTEVSSTISVDGIEAVVTLDPVSLTEYVLKFESDEVDDVYVEAESLKEAVRMFENRSAELGFTIEADGEEIRSGDLDLTEAFSDVIY